MRVVRAVRGNYQINIRAYGKRCSVRKYMEIIPDQSDQENHFLNVRFSLRRGGLVAGKNGVFMSLLCVFQRIALQSTKAFGKFLAKKERQKQRWRDEVIQLAK